MAVPGVSLLQRVIVRVWEAGQHAPSQLDFELTGITLRYLGQQVEWLRGGVTWHELMGDLRVMDRDRPTLDTAAIAAFGVLFAEYSRRSRERRGAREAELWNCIPDFDPTVKIAPFGKRLGIPHNRPDERHPYIPA